MPKKRFSVEQIINHLHEAEILLARGQTVGEVCRHIGVSEQQGVISEQNPCNAGAIHTRHKSLKS